MTYKLQIELVVSEYEKLVSGLSKGLRASNTSQKKMAKKLGVSVNTLSNWKKNPLSVPPQKLKNLAKFV